MSKRNIRSGSSGKKKRFLPIYNSRNPSQSKIKKSETPISENFRFAFYENAYLRTQSFVISFRLCTPHIAMVSFSSAPSFSTRAATPSSAAP